MTKPEKDTSIGLEGLPFQVHFSPGDFDDFINAHGIRLKHYKAMRCPVGLKSRYDTRRTDDCHENCSNGFIYTYAGEIDVVFSGNNSKLSQYDPGMLFGSTVTITAPRFYSDCQDKPVHLLAFDRLYLPDEAVLVPMWELFEAHETGVDRLRFQVVEVNDLIDNLGKRYTSSDFKVEKGRIIWTSSNRPGIDPDTGNGRVCSVRYFYRPFYYIAQLIHEVRVATVEDLDGTMKTVRMPQSAMLQREYVFQNEKQDEQAINPNSPRQVKAPADGGFLAR